MQEQIGPNLPSPLSNRGQEAVAQARRCINAISSPCSTSVEILIATYLLAEGLKWLDGRKGPLISLHDWLQRKFEAALSPHAKQEDIEEMVCFALEQAVGDMIRRNGLIRSGQLVAVEKPLLDSLNTAVPRIAGRWVKNHRRRSALLVDLTSQYAGAEGPLSEELLDMHAREGLTMKEVKCSMEWQNLVEVAQILWKKSSVLSKVFWANYVVGYTWEELPNILGINISVAALKARWYREGMPIVRDYYTSDR